MRNRYGSLRSNYCPLSRRSWKGWSKCRPVFLSILCIGILAFIVNESQFQSTVSHWVSPAFRPCIELGIAELAVRFRPRGITNGHIWAKPNHLSVTAIYLVTRPSLNLTQYGWTLSWISGFCLLQLTRRPREYDPSERTRWRWK